MPELPDIQVYIEALEARILGQTLESVRVQSASLLKSVDPPLAECHGREVTGLRRLGKRIAIGLEDELHLVIHLMIAGRLHWKRPGAKLGSRRTHAGFDFPNGCLLLTEASTKKRASLHVVRGDEALAEHDPGGLEVLDCSLAEFREGLMKGNHTLKRCLTNPHTFSGIGNAYSDEILHAARLSPIRWTHRLTDEEVERLYHATRSTLTLWTERLREQTGEDFPEKVTAFRPEMAVHGRFREPCPVCRAPVQRIARSENEINYCAGYQTDGKVLADRALSRLLKGDWPRTLEEWELRRPGA